MYITITVLQCVVSTVPLLIETRVKRRSASHAPNLIAK